MFLVTAFPIYFSLQTKESFGHVQKCILQCLSKEAEGMMLIFYEYKIPFPTNTAGRHKLLSFVNTEGLPFIVGKAMKVQLFPSAIENDYHVKRMEHSVFVVINQPSVRSSIPTHHTR